MGCLDSIMKLFRSGDHIVCGENVYGGTFRLFDKILRHMGLRSRYVDTRDPQRVEDAMTPATRGAAGRDADESADAAHRPARGERHRERGTTRC